MPITATALGQVVPTLTPGRAASLASQMDFILPKYGISSANILHEFLANVAAETGGFRLKDENLNYRSAERICQVWPSRFTTLERIRSLKARGSVAGIRERMSVISELEREMKKAKAEAYAGEPAKLANLVYAGRMGNTEPGDGFLFRGGGFAMITGRGMYEEYRRFCQFDTLENLSRVVRTDDWWAMDSAAWFFAIQKKLIPLAIADNLLEVVHRWNGGYIGLEDRKAYYARAQAFVK